MKKVILTGAAGYIGQYCIPVLLEKGFEVHAFSRKTSLSHHPHLFWHAIDLLETRADQILKSVRPEYVLHLAWETEHGVFWNSPNNLKWLEASKIFLTDFHASGGKRFVSAGTVAEYDWHDGNCVEGKTKEIPATPYGQAKKAFSDELAFANTRGLSTAVGRVFFLYGPGEPPNRLIPAVIRALLKNEVARCSNGTQVRDFMYVADVADALVSLLLSDVLGSVNIASGQPVRVIDLVNQISILIQGSGRPEFGAIARPEGDPEILTASTRRLSQELRWNPKISLEQGLLLTIDGVRSTLSPSP
jgi:UDP-glucuronate decarboxylase